MPQVARLGEGQLPSVPETMWPLGPAFVCRRLQPWTGSLPTTSLSSPRMAAGSEDPLGWVKLYMLRLHEGWGWYFRIYQARRRMPGFLIHQEGGKIQQTHFSSMHQAVALGRAP